MQEQGPTLQLNENALDLTDEAQRTSCNNGDWQEKGTPNRNKIDAGHSATISGDSATIRSTTTKFHMQNCQLCNTGRVYPAVKEASRDPWGPSSANPQQPESSPEYMTFDITGVL